MLWFKSLDMFILTPPHTGSRSLHTAAEEAGALRIHMPCPDGSEFTDHHGRRLPSGLTPDTRVCITVRNPFDRAVGLWWHLVEHNRHGGWGCSDFAEYTRWLAAGKHPTAELSWMYLWSIDRWLDGLQQTQHLLPIRYENLVDDFRFYTGLSLKLPTATLNERAHWSEFYRSDDAMENVAEWAAEERKIFPFYSAYPPPKNIAGAHG